ncbi:MAG: TonB-dependent receptor [Bacteroidales bacterium]|nr:TonB-dependent receptor [Bacteroidales bacterium]
MNSIRKASMTVAALLLAVAVSAQNLHVEGTVTDASNGEPVIGAFVLQAGTQNGTTTDIDGNYSIDVPSGSTLQFSSIGYKTAEKHAASERIDVLLELDSQLLDDAVVIGYSVVKKRDVLGAVSTVDNEKLTAVPVASVQSSLQGRVAGVEVSSQTGAPGSSISVRVRGTSSVSSGNDPLYIVDGIPVEGALNSLSPSDIETITVLKDASSAAIYGSRASNGVVLITTRTGKSGRATISYNMQTGVQVHGHLTEMANTQEYISLYNEAAAADNATSIVKRPLIEGEYIKDFADVNHLKEIFRPAAINNHELSISGGSKKTQYMVAGSYYNQQGIIRGTNYDRANVRSNITSQVNNWLKFSLNANAALSRNRSVSSSGDGYAGEGGSVVRYALFRNPAIPVTFEDGRYVDLPSEYYGNSAYNSFFGDGYSPEGLCANTDRTTKQKLLLLNGNVLINFTKNIFWKTTAGIDYRNSTLRVYNPTWGTNNRINSNDGLDVTSTEELNWTVNSTFNHLMTFGKHNVSYLIGGEAVRNHANTMAMSDSDFPANDPALLYVGKGNGVKNQTQGESGSSLLSFFAQASYNYDGKYYVSGIIREDGSSRFSKGNRWGTFYSVSAGWNMEQEEWMKDVDKISKLKLRAGFGSIGNQNIGLYAYSDRYSQGYYYAFGGGNRNGYAQVTLGNSDLKWETSNQFNVGMDMEFLRGEVGFSLDYYYKVTKDMLVEQALPLSIGNSAAPWVNNGSVLNTGVDVEFFYRKNFRDGGFEINLNGGYLHNEVLSLNAPILGGRVDSGVYATKTEVGYPIGSFFVYKMEGIFQDDFEIMTSPYQGKGVAPGDVKYADVYADNVIDEKDRTFMGSAIPNFNLGLNLSGNYKGFFVSAFFQGAFGQKIFSQVNYDIEGFYRGFNVTKRYYDEHWTAENHSNTQPRASWQAKGNNVKVSSRFLEDGSYFRLKNLQLGYDFKLKEDFAVKSCRLFIAGTNLFTLTGYSGLDPEMTVSTNSAAEGDRANGIDWGTYPVARSFTLGLNISF